MTFYFSKMIKMNNMYYNIRIRFIHFLFIFIKFEEFKDKKLKYNINTMIFICETCKKTFKLKTNLERHINKKYKCKPKLEIIKDDEQIDELHCKYCNREFSNKYNNMRHEQNCKIKKQSINFNNKIEKLEHDIELLKDQHNIGNQIIHNGNNSNINNFTINNIMLNAYGNENKEYMNKLAHDIMKRGFNGCEAYTRLLYFNNEHPDP